MSPVKSNQTFKVRNRPTQQRARETFDQILHTTTLLLEEVGFDKLNTNLICKRANLTPPALYRYFPNKYSILEELGRQLIEAQNACFLEWMDAQTGKEITSEDIAQLLRDKYATTCKLDGAKWIMRSLRSIPSFAHVRRDSNLMIVHKIADWYTEKTPKADPKTVSRKVQIMYEASYALIEMLMDHNQIDREETFREAAVMFIALRDTDLIEEAASALIAERDKTV